MEVMKSDFKGAFIQFTEIVLSSLQEFMDDSKNKFNAMDVNVNKVHDKLGAFEEKTNAVLLGFTKSLSSKTTPQQSSSSKSVPKTPPSSAAHHGGSSASEQRGCPPTAPPPATTPRPTPTNQRKPKSKYQEKTKVLYVEQLKSQRLKKKLNVLSKQQKPTAPMRILKLFGLPKTLLKLSRMSSQNLQLIV